MIAADEHRILLERKGFDFISYVLMKTTFALCDLHPIYDLRISKRGCDPIVCGEWNAFYVFVVRDVCKSRAHSIVMRFLCCVFFYIVMRVRCLVSLAGTKYNWENYRKFCCYVVMQKYCE